MSEDRVEEPKQTVADIDEFALIDSLIKPGINMNHSSVKCGIGDDCAVIAHTDGLLTLLSSDMTIEGVHFTRSSSSASDVGKRSVITALSDIAAMGGKVEYITLSLAVPLDTSTRWIESFFAGVHAISRDTGVSLVGGDTSRSLSGIFINVSVVGAVSEESLKLRSSAQIGDVLCVTGTLGDSKAGLRLLSEGSPSIDPMAEYLVRVHRVPEVSLEEGEWLGQQHGVHAMMDVSDGLASDVRHIARASGVGVVIDVDRLPLSMELRTISDQLGWKSHFMAASGGEEYVLLITVARHHLSGLSRAFEERFHRPLHPIGRVVDEGGKVSFFWNGESCDSDVESFHHFS